MPKKKQPEEIKEESVVTRELLLLTARDGEKKIVIPADAKITFGPAIPYVGKSGYGGNREPGEYALRIYQGTKENLIAVFTGVREFRDVNMPVAKKVIEEAGKTLWKNEGGEFEVRTKTKRKESFVDVKALNAKTEEKVGDPDELF